MGNHFVWGGTHRACIGARTTCDRDLADITARVAATQKQLDDQPSLCSKQLKARELQDLVTLGTIRLHDVLTLRAPAGTTIPATGIDIQMSCHLVSLGPGNAGGPPVYRALTKAAVGGGVGWDTISNMTATSEVDATRLMRCTLSYRHKPGGPVGPVRITIAVHPEGTGVVAAPPPSAGYFSWDVASTPPQLTWSTTPSPWFLFSDAKLPLVPTRDGRLFMLGGLITDSDPQRAHVVTRGTGTSAATLVPMTEAGEDDPLALAFGILSVTV